MKSMSNIAKGVYIGDEALAAFMDIVRNSGLKDDLFDKMTNGNVRYMNVKNNFPRKASYYHTLQELEEKPMEFKRFFFGNLVSGYNIDGLDIGWAYTTDINQNRLQGGSYASSADFIEFQRLLRGDALTRGTVGAKGQNIHVDTKYKDYNLSNTTIEINEKNENDEENGGISPVAIGDLYEIGEENVYRRIHKVLKKTHYDYVWYKFWAPKGKFYTLPNKEDVYKNSSYKEYNYNITNELLNYIKEPYIERDKYKTIDEIKNLIYSSLTVTQNKAVLDHGDKSTILNYTSEFLVSSNFKTQFRLKKGFELNDLKSFINEKNKGLFEYSLNYRRDNEDSTESLLVYSDVFSTRRYTKELQYGLSDKDIIHFYPDSSSAAVPTSRYYNVNDNLSNKLSEDFIIDTSKFGEHNDSPYFGGASGKTIESDNGVSAFTDSVGLLKYTENLFRNCKINSLVNRFHTNINKTGEKETLSRGRNLKSQKNTTIEGYDNPYCRVWTAIHQYSSLNDAIRPFHDEYGNIIRISDVQKLYSPTLRPNNGAEHLTNNSVLQDNGFVRITPTDASLNNGKTPIQNYMFSIENLAWKDNLKELSKEQQGPNKGRIMWFPPYNLKFSENVNVSWNGNSFIGRGEQIYTYTNTERSGTLDFTLLIDHPSMLNEWRGTGNGENKSEEELLRFFAGDKTLERDKTVYDEKIVEIKESSAEKQVEEQEVVTKTLQPTTNKVVDDIVEKKIVIYFPFNFIHWGQMAITGGTVDNINIFSASTENNFDVRIGLKKLMDASNADSVNGQYNETTNGTHEFYLFGDSGLITGVDTSGYIFNSEVKNKLILKNTSYNLVGITIRNKSVLSNGTDAGNIETTKGVMRNRARMTKSLLYGLFSGTGHNNDPIDNAFEKNMTDIDGLASNSFAMETASVEQGANSITGSSFMDGIKVEVEIKFEAKSVNPVNEANQDSVSVNRVTPNNSTTNVASTRTTQTVTTVNEAKSSKFDNEYLYFTELSDKEEFIRPILRRIRHFDPAFHSITPEGFNARLTFLHQCTRQGPTSEAGFSKNNNFLKMASNLSFGRAPYCILRIGDFFNTKICIDSISINYDNGGGTQWDLNPEGAGVQPMFANVSISFKFLGGQDIAGPIEKLQNAITSNYYANASVYDKKAERKIKE